MDDIISFSVCMAVYRGDNAEDFATAVRSVYAKQTVKPTEIIVVVDGPIPDALENTLAMLQDEAPLRIIRFDENRGHAAARQAGLEAASNGIVALMDADDISVPDRFEKQLAFMAEHPDAAVIGGQIDEFVGTLENVVGRREVPCENEEIHIWLKGRCPFNQMSVTMLRTPALAVGGYQDWYCDEDYYLWCRMALAGYRFANLPDVLVNVRVGAEMYSRRGGWRYFRSEAKLQRYMLRNKLIGLPRYLYNVAGRFAVQVAIPNKVRGFVFQKLFRK